jgi:hypothetical protein
MPTDSMVLPTPGGPMKTMLAANPAEFHQMHDLVSRDLRSCGNSISRQVCHASS